MTIRLFAVAGLGLLLIACASPVDRQWQDMQTILEHQERSR